MIGNLPAVLNLNQLFLKLDRFICNWLPVLPNHWTTIYIYIYIYIGFPSGQGRARVMGHATSTSNQVSRWTLIPRLEKVWSQVKANSLCMLVREASTWGPKPCSQVHLDMFQYLGLRFFLVASLLWVDLLIHFWYILNFMGDMWTLRGYLSFLLLKYDGNILFLLSFLVLDSYNWMLNSVKYSEKLT